MDDPTYLPVIQLDHVTYLTGCEIISGNETSTLSTKPRIDVFFDTKAMTFLAYVHGTINHVCTGIPSLRTVRVFLVINPLCQVFHMLDLLSRNLSC